MTETLTRDDRRFAIQRLSQERWQRATAANLAADHLSGYDLWTSAYLDGRQDWESFAQYLHTSTPAELTDYVSAHRRHSLAFVVMMMTGACNADCAICFTDRRRKRDESTPQLRDRLLHEAAELGAQYVYVPGEGEPTIDRGWWQFLDSCRDAGLEAIVFSNGLIFSHAPTSQKYWGCEPDEAVARLADYPVSLYLKMWSGRPELVGEMLGIDPAKYDFVEVGGVLVPSGMARALATLPRERLGVEVVVERRNADEVLDTVIPFAEEHGLAQIVEMIQHNGRTFGDPSYDPSPEQAARVRPYLSPTSCKVATCKAVITSQGFLSPRIAILENQLPADRVHAGSASLWDLLHTTDYIVQRRYEGGCLCESEPLSRAASGGAVKVRAGNVDAPALPADQPADASAGALAQLSGGFVASSSVAGLLAGQLEHGAPVALIGRLLSGPGESVLLADGPATVALQADVPADCSWVGVHGRWNAITETVEAGPGAVGLLAAARRVPSRGVHPESQAVRDPARLLPVVQRARLVALLRRTFDDAGYIEATTPLLQAAGEMCAVSQAVTEPIAGRRFFLRTDPEEYLKRYLSAGLDATYEVSMNVRADAPDDLHLVEFGLVEFYRRMQPFEQLLDWTDTVVRSALAEIGGREVSWSGVRVDTQHPFGRVRLGDLVASITGVDEADPACGTARGLASALREAGFGVEVTGELAGWRRAVLEKALDQHVLPRLRRPMWVTHFPADLALSSRLDPADPSRGLRAELYLPGGLELAHVYEVLVAPDELRERYDARRSHRVAAGMPYVPTNEGLMMSAEIGMPPMSGGGIGVDRLLMAARGDTRIGAGLLFAREGYHKVADPEGSVCGAGCGHGEAGCSGSCGTGHSC
ncbi:MAG: amino acid--tRNA ligase-related protein [Jatrophihabitans sp.]